MTNVELSHLHKFLPPVTHQEHIGKYFSIHALVRIHPRILGFTRKLDEKTDFIRNTSKSLQK